MKRALLLIGFVVSVSASTYAQSMTVEYHSAAELKQHFAQLMSDAKAKNSGSAGADLGSYGNHALKLSYRRAGGQAEVHAHFADVMVVNGGAATIVTGGRLVDAKNESDNEVRGKSIEGGTRQVLSQGDVIHIPAGTPHQLILDQGKDFQAFVIKIHD